MSYSNKGLQKILDDDPEQMVRLTFFVSGDTVPLQRSKEIYSLPEKTWYLIAREYIESSEMSSEMKKKHAFRLKPRGNHQWKVYKRADAEIIANFDFKNSDFVEFDLSTIPKFYQTHQDLVADFRRVRQFARTRLTVERQKSSPDLSVLNRIERFEKMIEADNDKKQGRYTNVCPDDTLMNIGFQV